MQESLKEQAQRWLTDAEFDKFYHHEQETLIRSYIGTKDGDNRPMLIVQMVGRADPSKRYKMIMLLDVSEKSSTQKMATLAGYELAKSENEQDMFPVAAILTAESWRVMLENGAEVPKGSLADEPDRQECVILSAMSVDHQRGKHAMYDIVRDKKGKITELKLESEDLSEVVNNVLSSFFRSYMLTVKATAAEK